MLRWCDFLVALLTGVGIGTAALAQLEYQIPVEQYPAALPEAAPFTLTPGDTVFVGHSALGASRTLTFGIDRQGLDTLEDIALSGDASADFSSSNEIPGSSRAFDVVFTPTRIGRREATLTLTDSSGAIVSFTLLGRGAEGAAAIDPFGGGLPIPNNNPSSPASSTIRLGAQSGTIKRVVVSVNIAHTFAGDLDVVLRTPAGKFVDLSLGNGGTGENFFETTFQDGVESITGVGVGDAPFTGSYEPDEPFGESGVLGIPAGSGEWTLTVGDNGRGDQGKVLAWSILVDREVPGQGFLSTVGGAVPFTSILLGHFEGGRTGRVSLELVNDGAAPLNISSVAFGGDAADVVNVSAGQLPLRVPANSTAALEIEFAAPAAPGLTRGTMSVEHDGSNVFSPFVFDLRARSTAVAGAVDDRTSQPLTPFQPGAIPNARGAVLTSSLVSTLSGAIVDLAVNVDLIHPTDGDLRLTLIAPNGTRILLSDRNGEEGDDYIDTHFSNAATLDIRAGAPPFTGTFKPTDPIGFTALSGALAAGTWKLEVGDLGVDSGGVGRLLAWSLEMELHPPGAVLFVRENGPALSSGHSIDFGAQRRGTASTRTFSVANNGTSNLEVTQLSLTGSAAVSLGGSLGSRGTIPPGGSETVVLTYNSATFGVTEAILGFRHNAINVEPTFTLSATGRSVTGANNTYTPLIDHAADTDGVTTSTIQVDAAARNVIRNLRVNVDLTHSFMGDLEVDLTSPAGTTRRLFSGHGGSANDMRQITFDDEARDPVSFGRPPYRGRFRPDESRSMRALESQVGTWTLTITDTSPENRGALLSWSLEIDTFGPGPLLRVAERTERFEPADGFERVGTADGFERARTAGGFERAKRLESGRRPERVERGKILDFGTCILEQPKQLTLRVENVGSEPIDVGTPTLAGAQAASFGLEGALASNSPPTTLAPGAGEDLIVSFDTRSPGRHDATLGIQHTGLNSDPPYELDLLGTGITGINDTRLTIPDDTPEGSASTISVDTPGTIDRTRLTVDIEHESVDNLLIALSHAGRTVVLWDGRGGTAHGLVGTTFDDEATHLIAEIRARDAPFSGSFRPEERLANFQGLPQGGDWTLRIVDTETSLEGALLGWSLGVELVAANRAYIHVFNDLSQGTMPDDLVHFGGVGIEGSSAVTFRVSNPASVPLTVGAPTLSGNGVARYSIGGNLAGGGTIEAEQSDTFTVRFAPTAFGSAAATLSLGHDAANRTQPFEIELFGRGVTAALNRSVAIPDGPSKPRLDSVLTVESEGTAEAVRVHIDVEHTLLGDLAITLVSPDRRTVLLFDQSTSGDNLRGTTFDDAASVPIGSGSAPYSGSFQPQQSLGRLVSTQIKGDWTLRIDDRAGGDSGKLVRWSLEIEPAAEAILETSDPSPNAAD